jgi:hypothetical protein
MWIGVSACSRGQRAAREGPPGKSCACGPTNAAARRPGGRGAARRRRGDWPRASKPRSRALLLVQTLEPALRLVCTITQPPRPYLPPGAAPLPRPQRWTAAVATLTDLQDQYRAWLDNLPASLEGPRLADKLQAIAELDLEELHTIDPPRGFGRD